MRDFTEDEDRLWRTLMRLNGALPRLLDDDLRGSGLTLSEFAVLLVLSDAEHGRLRMGDLATASGLSPSRTTRVVSELERRGLAGRAKSDLDARSAVATVTPQGRNAVRKAYPIQVDRARRLLFDQLDPAQVTAASEMLEPFLSRVLQSSRPA
ncbi:MarR family winged helix-turn-helix transcriptional regulator [Leifsonia sp. NPDC058248]|uniref:MarR family winged helix-turn-helix transcriptional regulator n=1 Tax=Leifsonia sp. NPDC058248 TaxID=3346402 RepID=UPI0036DBF463